MATNSYPVLPLVHIMGAGTASDQQALLAAYIFAANPYSTKWIPEGTWETVGGPPGVVTFETRPASSQAAAKIRHDSPYALDLGGSEMHEKPGEWKFKYADHYVARALRIPYMYYKPLESDDTKGFLVRDYFLIGFEGGMGY